MTDVRVLDDEGAARFAAQGGQDRRSSAPVGRGFEPAASGPICFDITAGGVLGPASLAKRCDAAPLPEKFPVPASAAGGGF